MHTKYNEVFTVLRLSSRRNFKSPDCFDHPLSLKYKLLNCVSYFKRFLARDIAPCTRPRQARGVCADVRSVYSLILIKS
jgi:hypothetical protein